MSDLSTLMNIAPFSGSYMMGQNQQQQMVTEMLKQRELEQLMQQRQQDAQFAAQSQPLLLRNKELANQTAEAGLPSVTAKAQKDQLATQEYTQTSPGRVTAENAQNDAVPKKVAYEDYQRGHDLLMDAGPVLDATPPPMRAQAFRQLIASAGMNPDAQHFQAIMSLPPEKMPSAIAALAEKIGAQKEAMNPAARSAKEVAKIHADASLAGDRIKAGATIQAAKIGAEARQYSVDAKSKATDLLTQLQLGKIKPDEAMVAAIAHYQTAQTPDEKQFWKETANLVRNYAYGKQQASKEGSLTLDTEKGGLTTRTVPPLFTDETTRGKGTADDPIVLKPR